MKIGLITTLSTNIGDDLIRRGICELLSTVFKHQRLEFVCVNKHKPFTVYPFWHPIHFREIAGILPVWREQSRSLAETIFTRIGFSRFDNCDLIVQCGAPVFWPKCSRNEWAKPLWHDVVGRLYEKIPVLNLAAGSCYPWEQQNEAFALPDDVQYIMAILNYCRLTTVRDRLAHAITVSLDNSAPLLPCSAFLAGRHRRSMFAESNYILINYMPGGGHYEWKQGIDPSAWENTVKSLIVRLGQRHNLAFLCHDGREYALAGELAPSIPRFWPKNPEQFFDCIAGAKFGICNRMHASVGMAGLGIPSIAVCTDTRLLMVAEIGTPTHYVKDIDVDILEEETERLLQTGDEHGRLLALQEETWNKYLSVIGEALTLS